MHTMVIDANNFFRRLLTMVTPSRISVPRSAFIEALSRDQNTIYVWDGVGANERRRQVYPGYKAKRPKTPEDLFRSLSLIREVLSHTGVVQLMVPGYEADDCIATLAGLDRGEMTIVSTDFDLYQLENVKHIPGFQTNLKPNELRLYKSLVGDPADNIPGLANFGTKSWERCNKERMQRIICDGFNPDDDEVTPQEFRAYENRDQLKAYWDIIGFYEVPIELIQMHVKHGDRRVDKGEALLKEYFM